MARKKIKEALAAAQSKIRQWTFVVSKSDPKDFSAVIKDEKGKTVLPILENELWNQMSMLTGKSKYMTDYHDMKGLATYVLDRGLVPLSTEEKFEWKKKKVSPIVIKEITGNG